MADKKPNDDAGYYMGWYVAYGLFACFAIYFFWQVKSVDFCVDDDKHCFRDWVSATGSWAAIPAAAITVIFLSKQIANSERHHRESLQLQSAFKYEVATSVSRNTKEIDAEIDRIFVAALAGNEARFRPLITQVISDIRRWYSADMYDVFEREFVIKCVCSIEEMRAEVAEITDAELETLCVADFMNSQARPTLELAREFNSDYRTAAETYTNFVDRFLDRKS